MELSYGAPVTPKIVSVFARLGGAWEISDNLLASLGCFYVICMEQRQIRVLMKSGCCS